MPATIFIYGRTDAGKTTLLSEIADYLISLGLKGRFVTADSGWGPFGDKVKPGNGIEAFDLAHYCTPSQNYKGADPQATLNALADGYWFAIDAAGAIKFTATAPSVDFYMFESLDSIADQLLQAHIRAGRKIAEDVVNPFTTAIEVDGKPVIYSSGAPGRAHYGAVQRYLLTDWWPRAKSLRTQLIFMTAHEAEGADDVNEKSVLGPKVIGRASVGSTTQLFQDSLHLVKNSTMVNNMFKVDRRLYYTDHPEMISATVASQSRFWPAKVSLPLKVSQDFVAKYPNGYMPFTGTEHIQELLRLRGYAKADGTDLISKILTTPMVGPNHPVSALIPKPK